MNIQRIQAAMLKQATVRRNVSNSPFVQTGSNGQIRSVTAGTPSGAPPRNMRNTPTSVTARGGVGMGQQQQQPAPQMTPPPQPATQPQQQQQQQQQQQFQFTPEQIQYIQQQRMMQMQRMAQMQRQWAMQQAAYRGYPGNVVQNTYGTVTSTRGYGPNGQLTSFTAGNVR